MVAGNSVCAAVAISYVRASWSRSFYGLSCPPVYWHDTPFSRVAVRRAGLREAFACIPLPTLRLLTV